MTRDAACDMKNSIGSGYVYVTGQSTGAGTGFDYTTLKYDPQTGDTIWVARYYNGTEFYYDYARAIAIDSFATTFMLPGYSTVPDPAMIIQQLNIPLVGDEEVSCKVQHDPGNNFDLANAIATDSYRVALYITGSSNRSRSSFRIHNHQV